MGQDLRTRILPRLGPGIFAYFDSPPAVEEGRSGGSQTATDSGWPFPLVVVVPVAEDRPAGVQSREPAVREPARVSVADALENALHTALALTAMDEKRNQGRSRITTQVVAGASVTTLDPPVPFAYAVDRAGSRLILSTSARSSRVTWKWHRSRSPLTVSDGSRQPPFPPMQRFFASTSISCAGWSHGTAIVSSRLCPPARTGRRATSTATSRKCWPWPGYSRPRSSRAGSTGRQRSCSERRDSSCMRQMWQRLDAPEREKLLERPEHMCRPLRACGEGICAAHSGLEIVGNPIPQGDALG